MKAALVLGAEQVPVYADFAAPLAQPGCSVIKVAASALSHVAKGRASVSHDSAGGGFLFVGRGRWHRGSW